MQTVGLGGDGDLARLLGGLDDGEHLAAERLAVVGLIGVVIRRAAVVDADQFAGALDVEGDAVGGIGDDIAVGVGHVDLDVRQVLAVRGDRLAVGIGFKLRGLAGGGHRRVALGGPLGDQPVVLVVCFGGDGALGPRHVPGQVHVLVGGGVLVGALVDLIGVSGRGGLLGEGLLSDQSLFGAALRCEVQLDLGRVGVDDDRHVVAGALGDDVLVPCGEDVQRVHVVVPLALIEVIGVLRESCGVDDAEVRVLRRRPGAHGAGAGAVPRGGFAEIVEAGPHVCAGDEIALDHVVPGGAGDGTPADCGIVIAGQLLVA